MATLRPDSGHAADRRDPTRDQEVPQLRHGPSPADPRNTYRTLADTGVDVDFDAEFDPDDP